MLKSQTECSKGNCTFPKGLAVAFAACLRLPSAWFVDFVAVVAVVPVVLAFFFFFSTSDSSSDESSSPDKDEEDEDELDKSSSESELLEWSSSGSSYGPSSCC